MHDVQASRRCDRVGELAADLGDFGDRQKAATEMRISSGNKVGAMAPFATRYAPTPAIARPPKPVASSSLSFWRERS